MRHLALLLCVLLGGCLPPWPLGSPAPGVGFESDDDDATGDDDDATGDDDDATGDDDDATGDDDDATGDDDDSTDPLPPDNDNDGSPDAEDCDDFDATIYPGAPEVHCDGVDQDCTGADICDVCTGATVVQVPIVTGLSWTDNGNLGPPDLSYVFNGDGPYYFHAYAVNLPLLTSVTVTHMSNDYGVWLEEYDDSCVRQSTDGGEFDSTATLDASTVTGASLTFVISSYLPLETGTFFFEVERVGNF